LFVLATFAVVANALYAQFWSTIVSILITLAGVPLYFLWMAWQRRRPIAPAIPRSDRST
jgi:Flp pilus assembly protein TadB